MKTFTLLVGVLQHELGDALLSSAVHRSDGPPAYAAHLLLDGGEGSEEYVLTLTPTDMRDRAEAREG